MSSADNYGLIDVSRRLWENAIGFVEPVHVSPAGTLLCPLCSALHVDAPLEQKPQSRELACEHRHSFITSVLDG